jgi:pumilio family protein 6
LTNQETAVCPPLEFHSLLYDHIKPHLLSWATGPSAFVVVGLLEAEGFEKKEEVLTALNKHRKRLEKAANEKTAEQKMEQGSKSEKGKSKKNNRKFTAGSTGSKLLLKMLQ